MDGICMERKKKVVFEDAGENKVAFGEIKDCGDFLEVKSKKGIIIINKKYIVFIRDGDF